MTNDNQSGEAHMDWIHRVLQGRSKLEWDDEAEAEATSATAVPHQLPRDFQDYYLAVATIFAAARMDRYDPIEIAMAALEENTCAVNALERERPPLETHQTLTVPPVPEHTSHGVWTWSRV